MKAADVVTIFGGTGFIGTHLTQHLLEKKLTEKIHLVDLEPPRNEPYCRALQAGLRSQEVEFTEWDVRKPIPSSLLQSRPDLIVNLAAIHREPGHPPKEYFETNLRGAENVCAYASSVGCARMVFTSSIAPYGPSEEMKDEASLPLPETPYGSSKLVAETIHQGWQASRQGRKLLILRPGVVFGPGENGNVTRLVKSVVRGYFIYVGNQNVRKAGGYVKELCFVTQFGLEHQDLSGEDHLLMNFSMNPPPTLERYVAAIREVAGCRRPIVSFPRPLLLGTSYLVDSLAQIAHVKNSLSPIRVRKLFRSTYIDPKGLRDLKYQWKFSLEDAFRDWKTACPQDFSA